MESLTDEPTEYLIIESDECQSTLIRAEHADKPYAMGEKNARIVKRFKAASWSEACQIQHDYYGWEPYVPMDD
jgi:hypothetical protein